MSGRPALSDGYRDVAQRAVNGQPSRNTAGRHRPPARPAVRTNMMQQEQVRYAPRTQALQTGGVKATHAKPHAVNANRVAMYAFVTLALVLLFIQISQLAQIAYNTKRISSLTSDIQSMKGETGNLQVRLGIQQNATRVREEATYRLGMKQPEAGQIRVLAAYGQSVDTQTQTAMGGPVSAD